MADCLSIICCCFTYAPSVPPPVTNNPINPSTSRKKSAKHRKKNRLVTKFKK